MKTICFYFQIHQPFRLKRYRFFDIGNDHYYYDDFANDDIITRIAQRSYLPANATLLEMIKNANGKFKVAFSISGVALEQLEVCVPEFIDSMKELVKTDCVEFLSETYAHSLASLCDDIASMIASMGFKGVITEGAKHILGWKSPNYLYSSAAAPKLKMLLKNYKMSDDISFRFSNYEWSDYPLTAEKFISWVKNYPEEEPIVNLFMNYETLGELQPRESGIFEFMKALPRFAEQEGVGFCTPTEAISKLKPVDMLSVPYPMSWADEARDTSAWLGNTLQNEAFRKLYSVAERVRLCDDRRLKQDWYYLQASDHFYYMCTKYLSDGAVHSHYSPYDSPYEAFTNYMNVLSDFIVRVEAQYPESIENEELNALLTTIRNQSAEIEMLQKELKSARIERHSKRAEAKKAKEAKAAESSKKVVSKKD